MPKTAKRTSKKATPKAPARVAVPCTVEVFGSLVNGTLVGETLGSAHVKVGDVISRIVCDYPGAPIYRRFRPDDWAEYKRLNEGIAAAYRKRKEFLAARALDCEAAVEKARKVKNGTGKDSDGKLR